MRFAWILFSAFLLPGQEVAELQLQSGAPTVLTVPDTQERMILFLHAHPRDIAEATLTGAGPEPLSWRNRQALRGEWSEAWPDSPVVDHRAIAIHLQLSEPALVLRLPPATAGARLSLTVRQVRGTPVRGEFISPTAWVARMESRLIQSGSLRTMDVPESAREGRVELSVQPGKEVVFLHLLVDRQAGWTLQLPDGTKLSSSSPPSSSSGCSAVPISHDRPGNSPFGFPLPSHAIIVLCAEQIPPGKYVLTANLSTGHSRKIGILADSAESEIATSIGKAPFLGLEVKIPGRKHEQPMFLGDRIPLTFALAPGSAPPRSFEVEARVEIQSRSAAAVPPTKLALQSTGPAAARALWNPAVPGSFSVKATARGIASDGTPFTLDGLLEAHVSLRGGSVLAVSEQPIDTNRDGRFERIDVHIDLEVACACRFTASVNGAHVSADLAPGRRRLTVPVDVDDFANLRTNGPLALRVRVDARQNEEFAPVRNAQQTFRTRPYPWTSFQREPLNFTGKVVYSTRDTNRNGRPDTIVARVGVVGPGGSCEWQTFFLSYSDRGVVALPPGESNFEVSIPASTYSRNVAPDDWEWGVQLTCGELEATGKSGINLRAQTALIAALEPPPPGLHLTRIRQDAFTLPIDGISDDIQTDSVDLAENSPIRIRFEGLPATLFGHFQGHRNGSHFELVGQLPYETPPGRYSVKVIAEQGNKRSEKSITVVIPPSQ